MQLRCKSCRVPKLGLTEPSIVLTDHRTHVREPRECPVLQLLVIIKTRTLAKVKSMTIFGDGDMSVPAQQSVQQSAHRHEIFV
jgi:hypothetical protein